MKKKVIRYILTIAFICVSIWKPFIFRLVMAIVVCILPTIFGVLFIQNTFKPFIGKDEFYGGLTDKYSRIYTFLIGVGYLTLVFGIILFMLGFNIGSYLGVLSKIILMFTFPFMFLIVAICQILRYIKVKILLFIGRKEK